MSSASEPRHSAHTDRQSRFFPLWTGKGKIPFENIICFPLQRGQIWSLLLMKKGGAMLALVC